MLESTCLFGGGRTPPRSVLHAASDKLIEAGAGGGAIGFGVGGGFICLGGLNYLFDWFR